MNPIVFISSFYSSLVSWYVSIFLPLRFHPNIIFQNHSCDPNCRLYACYINEGNIQKPLLAIFSRRDIEPYEEICFNYQGIYDDGDEDDDEDDGIDYKKLDPDHGSDTVYGRCRCGAKNCTGKFSGVPFDNNASV